MKEKQTTLRRFLTATFFAGVALALYTWVSVSIMADGKRKNSDTEHPGNLHVILRIEWRPTRFPPAHQC